MPKLSELADILLDPEDAERLSEYTYYRSPHGYMKRAVRLGNKKTLGYLHHDVIGKPADGLVVDHINRNKSDNRKSNLRVVSRSANGQNQRGWGRVKYRGVYFDTRREVYVAMAKVPGLKQKYLCGNPNPVVCAIAYDNFVLQHRTNPMLNFTTIRARKKALLEHQSRG